jgi:predicted enzyme related to lactoylglutathione lyase
MSGSTNEGNKTVQHPVTDLDAVVKDAPRDVGGGRLVATVTDPDGNVLGLLQDR